MVFKRSHDMFKSVKLGRSSRSCAWNAGLEFAVLKGSWGSSETLRGMSGILFWHPIILNTAIPYPIYINTYTIIYVYIYTYIHKKSVCVCIYIYILSMSKYLSTVFGRTCVWPDTMEFTTPGPMSSGASDFLLSVSSLAWQRKKKNKSPLKSKKVCGFLL